MPHYLREEIKVHIIQSRDHILNTYAEKISNYAEVSYSESILATLTYADIANEYRRNDSDAMKST